MVMKKYISGILRNQIIVRLGLFLIFLIAVCSCSNDKKDGEVEQIQEEQVDPDPGPDPGIEEETSFVLPEIDLNNWKVTLPISANGKPIEVEPPEILDYEAWEHWEMNGSRDIQTRAREKAEKLLTEYEAPEIDIAIKEALDNFVEKRQEEISPSLA